MRSSWSKLYRRRLGRCSLAPPTRRRSNVEPIGENGKPRELRLEQRHAANEGKRPNTSPQREQPRYVVEARKQGDIGNNVGEKEETKKRGGGNSRRSSFFRHPPQGPGGGLRTFHAPLLLSANFVARSHFHTRDQQRSAVSLLTGRAFCPLEVPMSSGSSLSRRSWWSGSDAWQGWNESTTTELVASEPVPDERVTKALHWVQTTVLSQTRSKRTHTERAATISKGNAAYAAVEAEAAYNEAIQ